MALTKVSTDGVKDDAVTSDKVADSINSAIAANTAKTQTTINSNADNRLITGTGTANTLNAESNATFTGTKLNLGPYDGGTDVNFNIRNTNSGGYGAYISGGSGTNYILRLDDKDQNNMFRFNANGKLGIGTGSPTGQIHLYQASNDPYIYIQRGSGDTAATIGGIFWKNSTNNLALIDAPRTAINDAALRFYTMGGGSLNEHMRIASNGEVGIGLTNPEAYGQNGNGSMGLVVEAPSGSYSAITIRSGYAGAGSLNFADGSGSNAERRNGFIDCDHVNKRLNIGLDGSSVARFTTHGFHPNPADSAAANALNDYEEGSWTPAFNRDTSGFSSLNTSVDLLTYRKIGSVVYISGRVLVGTSNNGANGSVRITLPFTNHSGHGDQSGYAHIMVNTHGVNLDDDTIQLFAEIAPSQTTMNLHQVRDNANWLAFNSSQLQHNNNEYFGFVGSYVAA